MYYKSILPLVPTGGTGIIIFIFYFLYFFFDQGFTGFIPMDSARPPGAGAEGCQPCQWYCERYLLRRPGRLSYAELEQPTAAHQKGCPTSSGRQVEYRTISPYFLFPVPR